MKIFHVTIIVLSLFASLALGEGHKLPKISEGLYEDPKGGPPTAYKIYKSRGKVAKITISPDLSSHTILVTAIFANNNKLCLVTVEMWDLLDHQANPLKLAKFKSIVVYQFQGDQITYRSSKEENMYLKSERLFDYVNTFIKLAIGDHAEQGGAHQSTTRSESKPK